MVRHSAADGSAERTSEISGVASYAAISPDGERVVVNPLDRGLVANSQVVFFPKPDRFAALSNQWLGVFRTEDREQQWVRTLFHGAMSLDVSADGTALAVGGAQPTLFDFVS